MVPLCKPAVGDVSVHIGGRFVAATRQFSRGEEVTGSAASIRPRFRFTFEAPLRSCKHAVRQRVFDDLLSGNYAKVYLHDIWSLYPVFAPYVPKR